MAQSIGPSLRANWQRMSSLPFGKWLFSRAVGWMAPYTGTIGACVQHLEPGHGVVVLKQRRKVQNHLRSVHAIALANLSELVTGLTLLNSLPDGTRGILTEISVQYLKKSRGLLTAECRCDIPAQDVDEEIKVLGEIRDEQNDVVATATATWLIGPEK